MLGRLNFITGLLVHLLIKQLECKNFVNLDQKGFFFNTEVNLFMSAKY